MPSQTLAILLEEPEKLSTRRLEVKAPGEGEVMVRVDYSGISTGTERLLWSGKMPSFPGMGYPLVPGYESVGRIVDAGIGARHRIGDRVFVPGANCFGDVKGLFGGAASKLRVPSERAYTVKQKGGESTVLYALAATAHHALTSGLPDLIVGHGVLGRLMARLVVAAGGRPVVWESDPSRRTGAENYRVLPPEEDECRTYERICDVSGDPRLLDTLIGRLARGGEIVLAGFYSDPLCFAFPPAFMKEARFRVSAEWAPDDIAAVRAFVDAGSLCLDGLITHRSDIGQADEAYRTAFGDPNCLKMILDWRDCQ